jgi:hypothetical protein
VSEAGQAAGVRDPLVHEWVMESGWLYDEQVCKHCGLSRYSYEREGARRACGLVRVERVEMRQTVGAEAHT